MAVEQRRVQWPAGGGEGSGFGVQGGGEVDGMDRMDSAGNWGILTAEMRRYEYEIGPSGGITYGAPGGYHDDCVMALALANHRRWETEGCGRMLAVGGSGRRQGARGRQRERVLVG